MTYLQSIPLPILVLLAIAIVYPILARGLLEWAYPKRLKIADLGRALIHDSKFTPGQKDHVWGILVMNGKSWPMWCLVVLAPIGIIASLWDDSDEEDREISGLLDDPRFVEMLDLDFAAHAAGSPLAAALLMVQFAFFGLTGIIFVLGIKGLRRALIKTLQRSTGDRHQHRGGAAPA